MAISVIIQRIEMLLSEDEELNSQQNDMDTLLLRLIDYVRTFRCNVDGLHCYSDASTCRMLVYLMAFKYTSPTLSLSELHPFEKLVDKTNALSPTLLAQVATLAHELMRKDDVTGMWMSRATTAINSLGRCIAHQNSEFNVSTTLAQYKASLSLPTFLSLANNNTIPREHRDGLLSTLSGLQAKHPTIADPLPKQRASTVEHFDYLVMQQQHLISTIEDELTTSKKC